MSEENFMNKLKCLFGFHKWVKFGGPHNLGTGEFEQRYICERCKKIKYKKW